MNQFLKNTGGLIGDVAVEPPGRVALEASANRVGRALADSRKFQCAGVDEHGVPTPMAHQHGAIGRDRVQLRSRQRMRSFAVIVEEPEHPLVGWRLLDSLAERRLDGFDGI